MNLWNEKWTPMLLMTSEKVIQNPDFLYEIKFDGIRAIIFITPNKVIIKNRQGEDITPKFPELQELKKITKQKIILDGEIVLFENNRPNFSKLLERIHQKKVNKDGIENPVIYMAFDLLYIKQDITKIPLMKRKKQLEKIKDSEYFMKVKTFSDGKTLFRQTKKLNLEGIVAKEKNSKYEINTRSFHWIKIKHQKKEVFYIGGYQEKNSNDVVSLLLGEFQKQKLQYVGKVTMAKKNPFYLKLINSSKLKSNPFNQKIEHAYFISPKYTCLVKYLERTKTNSLRHPIFQKIIEKDK